MIFVISPLNPVRFVPIKTFNSSLYQTKQFDEALQKCQTLFNQNKIDYYQKFTLVDAPRIQILSDYENIVVEIYRYIKDFEGSTPVLFTPTVSAVATNITNQSFKCYEFGFDFAAYGVGDFQTIVKYNSTPEAETPTWVEWISEPINIDTEQEGTLRYEYTNSDNNFSMIFNGATPEGEPEGEVYTWTGIFRVESQIVDFKPSSVDTIYDDEVHNTTIIMSRPFRQFSLALGEGGKDGVFEGIPDYMVDKVNRILSCNQVQIDGKYFCKSEGAQWEENRPENYQFSSQRITITESQNNFQLEVESENPNEVMTPIQKIIPYYNNQTNLVIANVFKKNTLLEKICIINTSGTPFDFYLSTDTTGGDDDIDPPLHEFVEDFTTTITINQLFGTDKTINITGIDENTLQIWVIYKKLDAPGSGNVNPNQNNGKNFIGFYYEMALGEFALDFDAVTGLGRVDTSYEGWAVCNGNHNTPDMRNMFILGTDGITDIATKPPGSTGGSFMKRIVQNNLPKIFHYIFGAHLPDSGGIAQFPNPFVPLGTNDTAAPDSKGYSVDDYTRIGKSPNANATIGKTNTIGGPNGDGTGNEADPGYDALATNFDITPPFRRLIVIMKIAESV